MALNLQPILENNLCMQYPLEEKDFDALYKVASDPKIWEQHPNKDRWKKEVFEKFFEGAMQSKGAFKIINKETGEVVGSTRFYDFNKEEDCIFIGYTFYAVSCWGKGFNLSVKKTMLDYLFEYVSKVKFHIGAENIRSQIAISRVGAKKVAEEEVAYFGEKPKLNFVYQIDKSNWLE
ncbi:MULTISPECIES: GNAT family N-acetyltransferase [Flavobacterium]|uniref:GNAT family N-acetyltransferase n=1 Tax=Flavobacterium TaxID=237 RepID=UPI001183FB8F|nr:MULTISPECIES: GNAT family N-acetyltransferase [Flavobacterium]MCR4031087.1 GNAT family N-acetyltransferase [Flavobacterium panacis]